MKTDRKDEKEPQGKILEENIKQVVIGVTSALADGYSKAIDKAFRKSGIEEVNK